MSKFNPRYLLLSDPDFAVKTYIILPHDLVHEVTQEVAKAGAMEIVSAKEKEVFEKELKLFTEYVELLDKANNIYNEFVEHVEEEIEVEVKEPIPVDNVREHLKFLINKLSEPIEKLKDVNKALIKLKQELLEVEYLSMLVEKILLLNPDSDTTLIKYLGREYVVDTFYGSVDQMKIIAGRALGIIVEVVHNQTQISSMIFTRKIYDEIIQLAGENIKKFDYLNKIEVKSLKSFLNILAREKENLKKSIEKFIEEKRKIVLNSIDDLVQLKIILDNEYERIKSIQNALKSKYLTLIIGWIPRSKLNNILSLQNKLPVKIEIGVDGEEPPAEFNNLKPFKSFEIVTEMFGTPSLRDWDPTPLLTYAFLLFFSLMLGDIGYSIGTIIGAKFILPWFAEDPRSEGFKKLQKMLYISGCGGIVVGIISRSFFGNLLGRYIPAQLQILPSDPGSAIGLSLFIGWLWIIFSHIVALIKNIAKTKDVYGVLSEIATIALLILGLPFSLYFISTRGLQPVLEPLITKETYVFVYQNINIVMTAIYIFLGLLIIAKIMTTKVLGAILWIFDISGALGDILSFARIGGIALSTLLLANVFNNLVDSLVYGGSVIGIILGIIVAILCHLFVLAISPIGPFVHSLRLCLVEISTKFYEGQNRKLTPLSIKIPMRITISRKK